jgi:lipopolysaccharide biosynthesis regulator YciM
MKLQTALMAILALSFSVNGVYAEEKTDSKYIKQNMNQLSAQVEEYIELSVKCLQENKKHKVDSCTISGLNKLSAKGSYVAQHALGNYYEEKGNKAKAIEFYNMALNNPKIGDEYKPEVEKDLERTKLK